ncbi:hypothetical protein ColTof4_13401 [Colletotrichum tofieldiae]|nr:hypothetical protein ColTof3_00524 [Colletotrichum tofieldiae]GKT80978.1 hypothetical protein ColTof4_13401 [Colletotrichum tofieldiae]
MLDVRCHAKNKEGGLWDCCMGDDARFFGRTEPEEDRKLACAARKWTGAFAFVLLVSGTPTGSSNACERAYPAGERIASLSPGRRRPLAPCLGRAEHCGEKDGQGTGAGRMGRGEGEEGNKALDGRRTAKRKEGTGAGSEQIILDSQHRSWQRIRDWAAAGKPDTLLDPRAVRAP